MYSFGERKRTKNTQCLQNKPCRDCYSVYGSVYVEAWVCYLSRGPLPFLVVPPTISSSCQCMYFLDRPWQPPLRARATSNGWCNKCSRRENNCQQLSSNLRLCVLEHINDGCVYMNIPSQKLEASRVPTLVEFLLGAVRGQSGSAGFRHGLSMYPCPTSAFSNISSKLSTGMFVFRKSSRKSCGSKLVHCIGSLPLQSEKKNLTELFNV